MKTEKKLPVKIISPEMQRLIDYMNANGGEVIRHSGGFWANQEWKHQYGGKTHFSTCTVQALVNRGIAEYSEIIKGRKNTFPVKAKLKMEAPSE